MICYYCKHEFKAQERVVSFFVRNDITSFYSTEICFKCLDKYYNFKLEICDDVACCICKKEINPLNDKSFSFFDMILYSSKIKQLGSNFSNNLEPRRFFCKRCWKLVNGDQDELSLLQKAKTTK